MKKTLRKYQKVPKLTKSHEEENSHVGSKRGSLEVYRYSFLLSLFIVESLSLYGALGSRVWHDMEGVLLLHGKDKYLGSISFG
jgi:hypothetical protein